MTRVLALGMAAATLWACDDPCLTDPSGRTAPPVETMAAADVASGVALLGSLTTVTLDNFTPTQHAFDPTSQLAFFRPSGGRLRIDDLGGRIAGTPDQTFTIQPTRREPYTIDIDDLDTQAVTYSAAPGRFIVRLAFESAGTDVRANGVENVACVGDPAFGLDDAVIELSLHIGSGEPLVSSVSASFEADVADEGVCRDNLFAFLCDLFAPSDDELRTQVSDAVVDTINGNPARLGALDDGVRAMLDFLADLPSNARIIGALVQPDGDIDLLYTQPCPSL